MGGCLEVWYGCAGREAAGDMVGGAAGETLGIHVIEVVDIGFGVKAAVDDYGGVVCFHCIGLGFVLGKVRR